MQEQTLSAKTPNRRRRAKLLAGSVALTMATLGGVVAVSAGTAYAFSAVTTQAYTISGASSVISSLTAAVAPTTSAATGNYTITFVTPSALTVGGATPSTITVTDAAGGPALTTATAVAIADGSTGFTYVSAAPTLLATSMTIPVGVAATTGSINAGDTVTVTFKATNPTETANTSFTFNVSTSVSPTAEATPSYTITPVTPGVTSAANTQALGYGAAYTITEVLVPTGAVATIDLQACNTAATATTNGGPPAYTTANAKCTPTGAGDLNGGTSGLVFSQNIASYSVTDTTSGTGLTVSGLAPIQAGGTYTGGVAITLSAIPTIGHDLTITATGTNPTAPEVDVFVPSFAAVAPVGSATISFGNSVTGVTVGLSNPGTGSVSTYMVGFSASTTGAMAAGGTITLVAPVGTQFNTETGAVVTDSTSGASQVIPAGAAIVYSLTTAGAATDATVAITTTIPVADSDHLTVSLFGVTNPGQGSYSGTTGLSVTTTADPIAATNAVAYVVGPSVVTSASPVVTASPNTPGSLSTYTVASFKAADALVGGTDTLEVQGPTGTEFPSTATLTDSTTTADTQTLTYSSGAGTNDVIYKLPTSVAAGDTLTLTLTSVVNPSGTPVGSTYSLSLGADKVSNNTDAAGTQGLGTPQIAFVAAASTYPDGGIVNIGGTFYVFAGLHAFGIASPTVLTALQAIDHATVQTAATGATVPTTAAATGTVIVVYNNPTIYVVGTDGQLHGFATPAQFLGDGFDPADVITVTGLGGITVGATAGSVGAGANALATSANGAIVNSSGTYYVFAGGKAFGIPTPNALNAVIAGDTATPLVGTITTANTGATVRSGVVVTYKGAVYVTSNSQLLEFKTVNQLTKDGYGGTPSIVIASLGGLAVVTSYSGS